MIGQVGSGYDILASPGPLVSGGAGFTVNWAGSS